MATSYTKDFLISAYLSRFVTASEETFANLEAIATKFYDEVGRDKFRVYASLDAQAIREAKASGFVC